MNITRFASGILLVAFVWITGCATRPDPLAGWKPIFGRDYESVDLAIRDDYRAYFQKLPPEEKNNVGPIELFESATGQHALKTEIPLNGTWWIYVLIYDKDNQRIKTIRYSPGGYRS
jgi:hypothetical protein